MFKKVVNLFFSKVNQFFLGGKIIVGGEITVFSCIFRNSPPWKILGII